MSWTTLIQIALQLLPTLIPQGNTTLIHAASAIAAYDPDTVKWLQGALNSFLGTNLKVDGIFGNNTRNAVLQAEERLGLQANGALTNLLITGLEAALKAVPKL